MFKYRLTVDIHHAFALVQDQAGGHQTLGTIRFANVIFERRPNNVKRIKADKTLVTASNTRRNGDDSSAPVLPTEVDKKQFEAPDGTVTDEKSSPLEGTVSAVTKSSAGEGPGEDDASKYPKPAQLYRLTFGLAMST